MSEQEPPSWTIKGKTIRQLIKELETFSEQDIEVKISTDGGETFKAISLVGKQDDSCCLINYE